MTAFLLIYCLLITRVLKPRGQTRPCSIGLYLSLDGIAHSFEAEILALFSTV